MAWKLFKIPKTLKKCHFYHFLTIVESSSESTSRETTPESENSEDEDENDEDDEEVAQQDDESNLPDIENVPGKPIVQRDPAELDEQYSQFFIEYANPEVVEIPVVLVSIGMLFVDLLFFCRFLKITRTLIMMTIFQMTKNT